MSETVKIQQDPNRTNAKAAAATKASALATLLVGLVVGLLTSKGIIDIGDGMTQVIIGVVASLLVPMTTKYAGYMTNFHSKDFIQVTAEGLPNLAVDVVSETLSDLDHKTGKRRRLKKILKGIGQAIKFLT